jgi:hypothetical protein
MCVTWANRRVLLVTAGCQNSERENSGKAAAQESRASFVRNICTPSHDARLSATGAAVEIVSAVLRIGES